MDRKWRIDDFPLGGFHLNRATLNLLCIFLRFEPGNSQSMKWQISLASADSLKVIPLRLGCGGLEHMNPHCIRQWGHKLIFGSHITQRFFCPSIIYTQWRHFRYCLGGRGLSTVPLPPPAYATEGRDYFLSFLRHDKVTLFCINITHKYVSGCMLSILLQK